MRAALGASTRDAAPDAAGREPAALRHRRGARRRDRAADGRRAGAVRVALLGARARSDARRQPAVGRRRRWRWWPRCCSRSCPRLPSADASHGFGAVERRRCASPAPPTGGCALFAVTQIAASFVLLAGAGMLLRTLLTLQATRPGFETARVLAVNVPVVVVRPDAGADSRLLSRGAAPHHRACPASSASPSAAPCPGATPAASATASSSRSKGARAQNGEDDPRAQLPIGVARILRGARHPARRRPRLHRGRSPRRRARRHRQPEHRAASSFPGRIRSTGT